MNRTRDNNTMHTERRNPCVLKWTVTCRRPVIVDVIQLRQMIERLYDHDDFEALVTIFSEAEGGRRTPPHNGIRWDFAYAEDDLADGIYSIWPDFYAREDSQELTKTPLPIGTPLLGRFVILNPELRITIHQLRIKPGIKFYCHEGGRRVARGVVTNVTGLHSFTPSD